MPYYTYQCQDCGLTFDAFSHVEDRYEKKVCPECHKDNSRKTITAPNINPFIFEHTIDGTKRGD